MAHKELVIEHYGVKGMKWGVRKGGKTLKSKVPSGLKRRSLSNSELVYGAIGLFATPIGAAGMLTAVSIENRRRTKKIIKNALGSEVGNYSKSSLNKARKQLNKYGVVTIETSKGAKTYGYSGLPI